MCAKGTLSKGQIMAGAFTKVYYHLVFSTKDRAKLIDEDIKTELYSYLYGIFKNENGYVLAIGGMSDHIHLLCSIPPKNSISDMIKKIKVASSKWLKERGGLYQKFQWQPGYGLFTVSHSQVDVVSKYIKNQKKHHENFSYKDEFRLLLKKHNIEFDEKFIWS